MMGTGKCTAKKQIKILNPVIRNFFLEQRFPREAFICK
jgi:hypothetical protein